MKILLLSAYDAASHRYWREGLVAQYPDIDWTVLALPARHFKWRVRGNSLSWAFNARDALAQAYDRVVATSLVDVAGLKALVPHLAATPWRVMAHENQFAYPIQPGRSGFLEAQLGNLFSLAAADRVAFNSAHNRDTCLTGIGDFIDRMPDEHPEALVEHLQTKSRVLPVPLEDGLKPAAPTRSSVPSPRLELIWNHRWEHDKGPERLAAAVAELQSRGVRFRLHLLGHAFRQIPPALQGLPEQLRRHDPDSVGHIGHIPRRADYLAQLRAADVVLSTAHHEFQGLAVMEAVACGCRPLVPDALAYPEYIPAPYRYAVAGDDAATARNLVDRLLSLPEEPPACGPWFWRDQEAAWREFLEQ